MVQNWVPAMGLTQSMRSSGLTVMTGPREMVHVTQ